MFQERNCCWNTYVENWTFLLYSPGKYSVGRRGPFCLRASWRVTSSVRKLEVFRHLCERVVMVRGHFDPPKQNSQEAFCICCVLPRVNVPQLLWHAVSDAQEGGETSTSTHMTTPCSDVVVYGVCARTYYCPKYFEDSRFRIQRGKSNWKDVQAE